MSDEWIVGNVAINGVRIFLDENDGEVTTGTATIQYFYNDGANVQYLQDDETTMNTTVNSIDVTHTAGQGFVHNLTIPISMDDQNITFVINHPSYGNIYSETHYVKQYDADDVYDFIESDVSPHGANVAI